MVGQTIGTYEVLEKLGQGGMGAVFKARDRMLQREVALKVMRPELAEKPEIAERFRSEAVTLARLNHPNVATVYNLLEHDGGLLIVMEYIPGEPLDDRLARTGAMATEEALSLFFEALAGIEHAHQLGIVHRDIKPANVMLSTAGPAKVMDFGIARVLGAARMTQVGSAVGSLKYMAPEQVRGEGGDQRSDIYALGILLYEMLTGQVPFDSTSDFQLMRAQVEVPPPPPRQFAPHIPEYVEAAILKALSKDPAARFQTAAAFRAALDKNEHLAAIAPTQTAPFIEAPLDKTHTAPALAAASPEPQKRSWAKVMVGLGALLVAAGLAVVLWPSSEPTPAPPQPAPPVAEAPPPSAASTPDAPAEQPPPTDAAPSAATPASESPGASPAIPSTPPASEPTPEPTAPATPAANTPPASSSEPPPPPAATSTIITLPEGTPVKVRLVQMLNSGENYKQGRIVPLVVAEDVVVNGRVVLRQGSAAGGTILSSRNAQGILRGELYFTVRGAQAVDGQRVLLSSRAHGGRARRGDQLILRRGGLFDAEVSETAQIEVR